MRGNNSRARSLLHENGGPGISSRRSSAVLRANGWRRARAIASSPNVVGDFLAPQVQAATPGIACAGRAAHL